MLPAIVAVLPLVSKVPPPALSVTARFAVCGFEVEPREIRTGPPPERGPPGPVARFVAPRPGRRPGVADRPAGIAVPPRQRHQARRRLLQRAGARECRAHGPRLHVEG